MKKRKQHYVWEHYLSAWATNRQIWCLQNRKIFLTNTDNVANSRDFYRLSEISSYDIQVIKKTIIDPIKSPHIRAVAERWIPIFHVIPEIKRAYGAGKMSNSEFEKELDVQMNNIEEDIHSMVESQAIPILAALRDADGNVLRNSEKFSSFMMFVAMQYLRTPRMKDKVVTSLSVFPKFNIEASWGLMRTILATNLGGSLNANRNHLKLTFLDAPSTAQFIAADQPLINIKVVGLPKNTPATELEFYYPLSPQLAVLLDFQSDAAITERRRLVDDEVIDYNRTLVGESAKQVYAQSEQTLAILLN